MLHRLTLAAVAALSLAFVTSVPVSAATATAAPVIKDASGKCHDSSGKFTKCPTTMGSMSSMTSMKGVTKDSKGKCHDKTGKYVKCPPMAMSK